MSDQYTPQRPSNQNPTPGAPLGEPYRTDVRVDVAPQTRADGGGFSSGALVALVFVVLAIIAAAVFSNRETFGFGAVDTAPAVTIENNAAPVQNAAPAETTVDPIAPTPAPAPEPAEPAAPVAPVSPVAPVNP